MSANDHIDVTLSQLTAFGIMCRIKSELNSAARAVSAFSYLSFMTTRVGADEQDHYCNTLLMGHMVGVSSRSSILQQMGKRHQTARSTRYS